MKRITIWMMALFISSLPFVQINALTLPEDEPVLVYSMPLTQLLLTAEYDEIVTEVGPFYQYSERYLGTKDVVTKSERLFVLNGVTFRPTACADTTRSYVLQDKSVTLQWVSLTPFGTLAGYNIESKGECRKPKSCHSHSRKSEDCETYAGTETTRLMPLLEEQLMASSTAKMEI